MILKALGVVLNGIAVAIAWFFNLLAAADALNLWLVAMGALLSYRFLLAPIFGQAAGSDTAAKSAKAYRTAMRAVRSKR